MPTATYTAISSTTLSSSASTVTLNLSSVQNYRDLIIVIDNAGSLQQGRIRFNGDTGFNYNNVYMLGDGAATSSSTGNLNRIESVDPISPQLVIHQIMDYSATDKHKIMLSRGNASSQGATAEINRWANTAAITSIEYYLGSGTFISGATINVFGVIA